MSSWRRGLSHIKLIWHSGLLPGLQQVDPETLVRGEPRMLVWVKVLGTSLQSLRRDIT